MAYEISAGSKEALSEMLNNLMSSEELARRVGEETFQLYLTGDVDVLGLLLMGLLEEAFQNEDEKVWINSIFFFFYINN